MRRILFWRVFSLSSLPQRRRKGRDGNSSSIMCAPDSKTKDAPQEKTNNSHDVPLTRSDTHETMVDSIESSTGTSATTTIMNNNVSPTLPEATTLWQKANYTGCGVVAGIVICAFSLLFPLFFFRQAAQKTYLPAAYDYVQEISHFDNTLLTYGTDYMITIAVALQIALFPKIGSRNAITAWRSKALLGCYAASVFFGGLCHQFYLTCAMRQTWHFRLLWTLCVGFVTLASGFMGAIATDLVRQDQALGLAFLPAIPAWFWTGFGATATVAIALGYFSFQRPACDIFVAGVTQFPSTFYLMAMLAFGLPTFPLNRWDRYQGLIGFIMMSVTLPSYPLAVQYTNLSLGTVNGILHLWLTMAWTAQGITLRRICEALQEADGPPTPSVPVKRKVS